jgi:hypothetical protein
LRRLGLLCALCLAMPVLAQGAPDGGREAVPDGGTPPLSLDDIQKALNADSAANTKPGSTGASAAQAGASSEAPAQTGGAARFFQSLNPDLSFIADFAAGAFNHAPGTPNGMVMVGDHDPDQNGFTFQALEMAASANVDPYFKFNANLTFNDESVEVEEAYGTTTSLPFGLQVRAGKFFTRFGRFNPTHPHTWNFSDQPIVLGRFFGGDGNRGTGLEVSELFTFLPWYVELVGSVTNAQGDTTNRSFLSGSGQPITSAGDLEYVGALKQFFPLSDNTSLSWGLSAAFGPNEFEGRTEIYGTDLYLKWRPLNEPQPPVVSLTAELLQRRYHAAGGTWVDSGGWAELLWRFAQRWATAVQAEYATAAQGHPISADAALAGTTERYKWALSFYPTEFSRLRAQYDFEPAVGARTVAAHAVFLNVEFAIGAHGAHAF